MRLRLLALSLIVATVAVAGSSDRFNYIYKRGNDSTMRINGSLESYIQIAKRWSGEFIWVDRGGRQYLIRDAAVLAHAREAFAHMEALEPALRAAEEKLRPFEEKYDAIEKRMDAISDRGEEDPAVEAQLRAVEKEMNVLEDTMERLEEEMERREEIAEAKFERIVLRAIDGGKAQRVK